MKNVLFKTKAIQTIFLIVGIFLWGSCQNNTKSTADKGENLEMQNEIAKKQFLVGSWKDNTKSALHFTLFKNGTARSDNMSTLLYKNWSVKENEITFTVESIGNGTSFTDNVTYTIEKLTQDELILKRGTVLLEYTKE